MRHLTTKSMCLSMMLLASLGIMAQATATYSGGKLMIENSYLSRQYVVEKGVLRTTAIVNKRTPGHLTIFNPSNNSEDFVIAPLPSENRLAALNTNVRKQQSNTPHRALMKTRPENPAQGKSCFTCSDMRVSDIAISDIAEGKHVTVAFAPYTFEGVTWNVKMQIEIKDGEPYMHKWLEMSVPSSQRDEARIDYIDFESLGTANATYTWTHPVLNRHFYGLNAYHLTLGQPLYVDGMFFGCEFPMTETQITDNVGHIRYYLGKSFHLLDEQQRLTDGVFSTWKSVVGATRSVDDMAIIQKDFFNYINNIATPSKLRIQFNAWYDWKLNINRDNIICSFKDMERGFSQNGMPPLDSYVIDNGWNAYGEFKDENTDGFWQFNSKFPNGLTEPSDFAHRVASNFGLWLGPRGGYTHNAEFAKFLESRGNGKYNIYSNDIVVNHKVYLSKLEQFFLQCQKKYGVNYWKLDGFSAEPAQPDSLGNYVTGGKEGMYYMTEHWERWIDIFKNMRTESKTRNADLWLNLTCFVNPSPWYLQWANSLWLQVSGDMARDGKPGLKGDADKLLTYRDGCYYDFINNCQFQFPLKNLFNHDPTYGKADCVAPNAMTKDEFRTYLMMIATRGAEFLELLYSANRLSEDQKWLVNAEALNWLRANEHILQHAIMFGGNPGAGAPYGYSAWDGDEGIISVRNPSNKTADLSCRLDSSMGVGKEMGRFYRATVLNANTLTNDDNFAPFHYGQLLTLSMAPGEVRIWKFQKEKDAGSANVALLRADSTRHLFVQFDRQIESAGKQNFTLEGNQIDSVEPMADKRSFLLQTRSSLRDGKPYRLNIKGVRDLWSNTLDSVCTFTYHANHVVACANEISDFAKPRKGINRNLSEIVPLKIAKGVHSLRASSGFSGNGDFSISFWLCSKSSNCSVMRQGSEIDISLDETGRLAFTVCGLHVNSDIAVNDAHNHFITVCRERNGMLKIYVDGEVNASKYDKTNVNTFIAPAPITLGSDSFEGLVGHFEIRDKAYSYDEVAALYKPHSLK